MPKGQCNPSPAPYNETTLAVANGKVEVYIRYGWDGVSVYPDCDGPLVNGTGAGNVWAIRVTNNDTISWWVHTVGKRGQPHDTEFTPGSVTTFTKNVAANNGYDSINDFSALSLTTSPGG